MVTCTRRGCGKEFNPKQSLSADCNFHPGQPIFHEGLKSWSCCKEKNKPVMEFDQFIKLQGCATGTHSSEKIISNPVIITPTENGKGIPHLNEKTSTPKHQHLTNLIQSSPKSTQQTTTNDVFKPIETAPQVQLSKPKLELEDDPESIVPDNAKCTRLSCGVTWNGLGNSKRGKLDKEECTYHPGTPIFHEGSKGYSCCKKRVLDFDDFLKLRGCKTSSHLFTGGSNFNSEEEESIQCRFDYYQTPTLVIVSVFAKNLIKDKSNVKFDLSGVDVDLKLPSNKRFQKRFELFGPIDTEQSTFKFLSTKCEMVLFKLDGRSWSNLEKGDTFTGTVTFGVGGRTGTVGAKQIVTN